MYGYMNDGSIFKIFGGAILVFELVSVFMFVISLVGRPSRTPILFDLLPFFCGFLILTAALAIGLLCVQRWAAVIMSALGVAWSLFLAAALGFQPWGAALIGMPIVFGLLVPLYVTVRNWSS